MCGCNFSGRRFKIHHLLAPVAALLRAGQCREQGVRDAVDDARVAVGGDEVGQNASTVFAQNVKKKLGNFHVDLKQTKFPYTYFS